MSENEIIFTNEDGTEERFFVIEETKLNDVSYLLVSDSDDDAEEADAYILKDVSAPEDSEAVYEFVDDETELSALADIFDELLGDETDLV